MWTRDCNVPLPDAYYGGTDDITAAYGTQENGFTTIAFRKRLTGSSQLNFWKLAHNLPNIITLKLIRSFFLNGLMKLHIVQFCQQLTKSSDVVPLEPKEGGGPPRFSEMCYFL